MRDSGGRIVKPDDLKPEGWACEGCNRPFAVGDRVYGVMTGFSGVTQREVEVMMTPEERSQAANAGTLDDPIPFEGDYRCQECWDNEVEVCDVSNQRVVALTGELTEPIYDILETCCGAQADGRGEFVAYMRGERNGEWRFGGWLGFGGKLYSSSQGIYVDCYPEHRSPLANFAIKTANERIRALLEHPEGITYDQETAMTNAAYTVMLEETELPDDFDAAKKMVEAAVAALAENGDSDPGRLGDRRPGA